MHQSGWVIHGEKTRISYLSLFSPMIISFSPLLTHLLVFVFSCVCVCVCVCVRESEIEIEWVGECANGRWNYCPISRLKPVIPSANNFVLKEYSSFKKWLNANGHPIQLQPNQRARDIFFTLVGSCSRSEKKRDRQKRKTLLRRGRKETTGSDTSYPSRSIWHNTLN